MEELQRPDSRAAWRTVYAVLMGFLMLSYAVVMAFQTEGLAYPSALQFGRIAAAVLGIWLGKCWKDRGFWFITVFFLYLMIRVAAEGKTGLFFASSVSENILNAVWAIGGCYALGRVLLPREQKTFFRVLVFGWTLLMAVHCILGIAAAWNGKVIWDLSGGSFWGLGDTRGSGNYIYAAQNAVNTSTSREQRLYLCLYPTVAGCYLSISGVAALGALMAEKRKALKAFYGAAPLLVTVALSLTDSRASVISMAAGAGVLAGAVLLWKLRRKADEAGETGKPERRKNFLAWAAAILCMAAVFGIATLVMRKITPAFNALRARGGVTVSAAIAEETEGTAESQEIPEVAVSSRAITASARIGIWRRAADYILQHPGTLVFGDSIIDPTAGMNETASFKLSHCHNMFLQIWLESGIIGILIVAVFTVYVALHALRVVNSRKRLLLLRVFAAAAASILVGDLAECFTWFRSVQSLALPVMFMAAGCICTTGKQSRKGIKK